MKEYKLESVKNGVYSYAPINNESTPTEFTLTEEEAIQRLTNLAQEKNTNWLGGTNIEAMKIVLNMLNPDMDTICDKLSKEIGIKADEALKDYRDMEKKALSYDNIYNRIKRKLEILPVNDFNTNFYAKGMYDAFNIMKNYLLK